MRYVEDEVINEVAGDIINIFNTETELALQINIAVILSLESEVIDIKASEVTNISNTEIVLIL